MASEFDPTTGEVWEVAYSSVTVYGDCRPLEVFADSAVQFPTSVVNFCHWIMIQRQNALSERIRDDDLFAVKPVN